MGKKQYSGESETSDNMEERILQAAGRLFTEKGFAGTSTTEIARSAGCNQALVHYYFRTKDNLFDRIFEEKVKGVFVEIMSVETGAGTFPEKLARLIGLHYDIIRENSSLVLFLINEVSRDPSRLVQVKNALGEMPLTAFSNFQKDLDDEIACGRIRSIDLLDLIMNIISLNAFIFIARPVVGEVWNIREEDMVSFLDRRKQEIVNTVLLSLRPVNDD